MGCFLYRQGSRRKSKQKQRLLRRWRDVFRSPEVDSPSSTSEEKEPELNDIINFSLSELKVATRNFEEKIGEGSFGGVYKGTAKLKVGKSEEMVPIAVKKLNIKGVQGQKEWLSEITFLRMVDHPNVVKLIGYCVEDDERGPESLLVYEYMPNKSLDYHIFERSRTLLSWNHRLQIAIGTARGLVYLHEEMKPQIIFRDLKAANILLDNEFQPKLSDFGLARRGPAVGDTHVTTMAVGTAGYCAPDYVQTGHLTAKSDVWSFGMVLLELVTGLRVLDWNRPRSERNLAEWARPYMNDAKRFQKIIDPRLKMDYPPNEARGLLSLVQKCIAKNPKTRPNMSQVVNILLQITDSPIGGYVMGTIDHAIDEDSRSGSYRGSSVSGSVDLSGFFSAEGNRSKSRSQTSNADRDRHKSSESQIGAVTNSKFADSRENGSEVLQDDTESVNRANLVPVDFTSLPEAEQKTELTDKPSLQENARFRGNLNLKEDARKEHLIVESHSDSKSSLDTDAEKNDISRPNSHLPDEAQEKSAPVPPSKSSQQDLGSGKNWSLLEDVKGKLPPATFGKLTQQEAGRDLLEGEHKLTSTKSGQQEADSDANSTLVDDLQEKLMLIAHSKSSQQEDARQELPNTVNESESKQSPKQLVQEEFVNGETGISGYDANEAKQQEEDVNLSQSSCKC